jgi:Putative Mg2+ and Co2+ transporter CorB
MILINLSLLVVIIFLILLSGFLSGSETAITATSKARIISELKKGAKRADYVKKIIDSKDKVISSLLLSNNLVNILASSLTTAFFYDLFGVTGIFYATLLMTFLLVIFAEVLPKTYAINKPTRSALMIGPIIFYLNKILTPFVFVINKIVKVLINKKEINDKKLSDEQSEEELQGVIYLYKTSNPDSEHEKEMLQSILTLNDTTVEEIFTHRRNIYSINVDLSLSKIIEMINKSRFYTNNLFGKTIPRILLAY